MSRYTQRTDGEWIDAEAPTHKIRCCDCGLVHVFTFRIVNGRVQFAAVRDHRATAQSRRNRKRYPLIARRRLKAAAAGPAP